MHSDLQGSVTSLEAFARWAIKSSLIATSLYESIQRDFQANESICLCFYKTTLGCMINGAWGRVRRGIGREEQDNGWRMEMGLMVHVMC